MSTTNGAIVTIAAGILGMTLPQQLTAASVPLSKVVETGDPAPGLGTGVVFEDFGTHPFVENSFGSSPNEVPRIDRQGNIGFHAFFGTDGAPGDQFGPSALFRVVNGQAQLIAQTGDPAPGTGFTFIGFPNFLPESPFMHDGRAIFSAGFNGDAFTHQTGVWSDHLGSLNLILKTGDRLPGMAAGASLQRVSLSSVGNTAFVFGPIADSGTPDQAPAGLWRGIPGRVDPIVVSGLQAAGMPLGVLWGQVEGQFVGPLGSFDINERGEAAFAAFVKGSAVDHLSDEGIWIETGNGVVLLLREGDAVPPGFFPGGSVFRSGSASSGVFSGGGALGVQWNNVEELVFRAQVDIPGGNAARVPSLWTTLDGELQLFLRGRQRGVAFSVPGDAAPGLVNGTFFDFNFSAINDLGHILVGGLVETNDDLYAVTTGFWVDRGTGELEPLGFQTGAVPGVPGATFTEVSRGTGAATLEADSTVLFVGRFSTGGTTFTGLFRNRPGAATELLLRSGATADIGGDGTRIVQSFKLGAGTSDNGLKSVEISFTDGSQGIYTFAATAPVPPRDMTPPSAPTGLIASAGSGGVNLDWQDNSEADLSHYLVFRSINGATFQFLTATTQSSFHDTTAPAGSTLTYIVSAVDTSGNQSGASSPASVVTPVPPQMHVASISVSTVSTPKNARRGRAEVVIVNSSGAPVSNADVTGRFTGSFSQLSTVRTDDAGRAIFLTSTARKGSVTFTFCVQNVAHATLTYDATANVERCDNF